MSLEVITKSYTPPLFDDKEILRYAGCRGANEETAALLLSVKEEAENKLSYKARLLTLEVSVCRDICDFGYFSVRSRDLAKNLSGCKRAVIFAATVGIDADRLISKYTRISPSRAFLLDALGSERIEALCDKICEDLKRIHGNTRPRFSPGYGDLAIEFQREIFALLSPEKSIGLCLLDSLLMSPTKSVSAIVGIL